jgi:hypothetical protein
VPTSVALRSSRASGRDAKPFAGVGDLLPVEVAWSSSRGYDPATYAEVRRRSRLGLCSSVRCTAPPFYVEVDELGLVWRSCPLDRAWMIGFHLGGLV